jgi:maltooligosyltrehalose trehalohydrolase
VSTLEPKRLLIAEDDRNDPRLITDMGLDGVWADDFHHQLRVTLTGERDGYYGNYEPSVEGIARAIDRGWLYEGQVYGATGKARGAAADALSACQLVYCIQNHDQVGNRALGERLSDDVQLDAYAMASMILLYLPMTPLLFMGQEWAASTPFLYFTDHEPELGALVTKGRAEEFRHFRAFSDGELRAKIPDPQALDTFERSRLRWDEREREPHAQILALYSGLLALRRTDAVMRVSSRAGLCADVPAPNLLRVRRFAGGEERVLYANFGREPVAYDELDLPAEYTILLTSAADADGEVLPPLSAAIFATQAVGVSS